MTQTLSRSGTGSFKKKTKPSKALQRKTQKIKKLPPDVVDDLFDDITETDTDIIKKPESEIFVKPKSIPPPNKKYYFDNPVVEQLLNKYVKGGCVDVELRDEIMVHASELIRQIIRAHNFEHIFPGRDSSSFFELFQVAWMQIEKVLYKYDPRPNSPKVFNMWSQIAKTRILAYLKKEKRDKKNVGPYKDFLVRKHKTKSRFQEEFYQFIKEAELVCVYNDDFLEIIKELKHIYENDEKPSDGLITKLEKRTGKSRNLINQFFKTIRMRSDEFTINMIDIRDGKENDFGNNTDDAIDSD